VAPDVSRVRVSTLAPIDGSCARAKYTGTDGFFRAHQVNVTHHANDDAFDFVDRNPLSYRVSAGKVSSGRFLIHHRHSRRSGTIAPVDHTPPAERLPHNVEVPW